MKLARAPATLIGLAAVLTGGVLFVSAATFFPYRLLGILLVMAGPAIITRLRGDTEAANANGIVYVQWWRNLKRTWPAGAAVSAVFLFSFYLLYRDGAEGYEQVFPVYLFFSALLALLGYVLYLFVLRQT